MNIQSYSRGAQAARDLLDRLGWGYDASSFAATAPPEMRKEAARVVFEPTEHETERAFRHYLGYTQDQRPEDWARSWRGWCLDGMAALAEKDIK